MAGRLVFNWFEAQDREWRDRYGDGDLGGLDLWLDIFEFPAFSEEWLRIALEYLHTGRFSELDSIPREPCVFISHRQDDYQVALDAAQVLIDRDVNVWLDVEDPVMQGLALHPDDLQTRTLIAVVIEMALINCSHVLVILTNQTRGSMWVPYEYGRIKRNRVIDSNAAMLRLDQRVVPPEYALLGKVHSRYDDLKIWPMVP